MIDILDIKKAIIDKELSFYVGGNRIYGKNDNGDTIQILDLSEHNKQIKADLIREVEEKVRAEVIEELFNIHCKDVSQNECDGYGGRCYQCKYERLVQKSLEMQELKIEEQK